MLNKVTAMNITKTIATYSSPLFVLSGFIIIAPLKWLTFLGINNFKDKYLTFISLVFIGSSAFILVAVGTQVFKKIKLWYRSISFDRQIIKYLKELTPIEKNYLSQYIDNKTQTQNFSLLDGVAQGLVRKNILYLATSVGTMFGIGFAFNIVPIAYKYLLKNKNLLK